MLSRNNRVLNLVDPLGVQSLGPIRADTQLSVNTAVPGLSYQDSRRATGQLEWRRDLTLAGGLRLTPFGQVRGDVFSTSDPSLVTVRNGVVGGKFAAQTVSSVATDDSVTRGLVTAGFTASYPLIRQTANYTAILEPIGQFIASPRLKRDLRIPNEDSVAFEFDESTLFSTNRLPGQDLQESGLRMNIGARASVFWGTSGNASVLVGRTFRDTPDPAFLSQSGVRGTSSDWVTFVKVQPANWLTFYNRARLDADSLQLRREEAGLNVSIIPKATFSAQYNYNENGLLVSPTGAVSTGRTQDLDLSAVVFPFRHWGASALLTRDFQRNILPVQQYALIYRDECIRLDLVYTRDEIAGAAIGVSNSIVLRLTLAVLGDTPVAARRNDSR